MNLEFDIVAFVAEALGNNKKIYKDMDSLYLKRKYEYYRVAKEHKLYTHQIITEGSLVQEEYCKKALGLLLLSEHYPDTLEGLFKIIDKGWAYASLFVLNHQVIDGEKFLKNVVKKSGDIDKVSDTWLNAQMLMMYFLAHKHDKKIIQNQIYHTLINSMIFRWEHYQNDHTYRISMHNASNELKIKVKALKNSIFAENGRFSNYYGMYSKMTDRAETIALLFDFDELSCDSVFEDIKFSDRDIDEILLAFVSRNETYILERAKDFLCSSIYIRYLIKAYKEVKKMHFKNNRETMFLEIEELEEKQSKSVQDIKRLSASLEETRLKAEALERENKRLQIELEKARSNRKELNSLREFLFNIDIEEEYTDEDNLIDVKRLQEVSAAVIGGHDKWQVKMKEYLPNYIFISPDHLNFDIKILEKVEVVFIYTNYLNHALYYKVMQALDGKDTKIIYIKKKHDRMVLKAMYQELRKN